MEGTLGNQTIGIAGVFVIAFFLFALRHCLLSLGKSDRHRSVNHALHIVNAESNQRDAEDDSWLFWSSDSETASNSAGEARRTARAPKDREKPPIRVISQ